MDLELVWPPPKDGKCSSAGERAAATNSLQKRTTTLREYPGNLDGQSAVINDEMKADHRLKDRIRIQTIRRNGQSVAGRTMVLTWSPNAEGQTRYAVIASRTVGGAVERNRCKRRLRARMSRNIADIQSGFDILMIARSSLLSATTAEVDAEFTALIDKAGLLK